jgi:hypothetical protein
MCGSDAAVLRLLRLGIKSLPSFFKKLLTVPLGVGLRWYRGEENAD